MIKPDGVQRGLVSSQFQLIFFLIVTIVNQFWGFVVLEVDFLGFGLLQVGEIISRFEKKGFKLKGLKLFECPKELAEVCFLSINYQNFDYYAHMYTSRRWYSVKDYRI